MPYYALGHGDTDILLLLHTIIAADSFKQFIFFVMVVTVVLKLRKICLLWRCRLVVAHGKNSVS